MRSRSAAVGGKEPAAEAPAGSPAQAPAAAPAPVAPPTAVTAAEFIGVGGAGRVAVMPPEFRAIVERVFTMDSPKAVYDQVLDALRPVRASRVDRGTVIELLDAAQQTAVDARQLLAHAKVTQELFDIDSRVVIGAMREQAIARLEEEKSAGTRKKAITEADVEGAAATMFPEAWRDAARQVVEAKQTTATMEALVDRAVDRARDLRAILNAMAG
jgi:hypothetical protein